MSMSGGCRCGAIRYEARGEPAHSAICHCRDCQRSAGAPMVVWTLFTEQDVAVTGAPSSFSSSDQAIRQFCGTCGTGLFYRNAQIFPGMVDIQTATFDDPAAFTPTGHIQWAEATPWMTSAHKLPRFDRYPGPPD